MELRVCRAYVSHGGGGHGKAGGSDAGGFPSPGLEPAPRSQLQAERKDDEWNWTFKPDLTEGTHESKVPEGIPVILITAMGPRVFPSFVTKNKSGNPHVQARVAMKFHQEWVDKLPNARHIILEEAVTSSHLKNRFDHPHHQQMVEQSEESPRPPPMRVRATSRKAAEFLILLFLLPAATVSSA